MQYDFHDGVPAFVTGAGSVRLLVSHMGREAFIEPHQLPPMAFAAIAAATNLPDAHNRIVIVGRPDSMNLHDAREAVITEFKALLISHGLASDCGLLVRGIG